jgi:hypothetical protein
MSRNKRRLLMIIDVTRSGTALCVAGAVAMKGTAFSRDLRRLNFVAQFSKFCANGRGQGGGT